MGEFTITDKPPISFPDPDGWVLVEDPNGPKGTYNRVRVKHLIGTYSETEQPTGITWIDGSAVFRKVVDFGALPDSTVKNVAHGITGLEKLVSLRMVADDGILQFSHMSVNNVTGGDAVWADDTDILYSANTDQSGYTQAYAIIEYTKVDESSSSSSVDNVTSSSSSSN